MTVLVIEETIIDGIYVTVTAIVEDMRLLFKATRDEPEEWAPALCTTSFELDPELPMPTSEDDFCNYLTDLDLRWELVDTSDWDLNS
jgi:hypothetical protein